jgi:putative transposase
VTNLLTLRVLAAVLCIDLDDPNVRRRLKRIQYRTDLLDGFLAHTGLPLEPDSTQASQDL